MSDSLPERPDLDQLRRRAKELRDAARRGDPAALARFAQHHPAARPDAVSLAAAQLVIAREMGYPSWPKFKAAIDAELASQREVSEFVSASVEGRLPRAGEILRADPGIATRGLLAAIVLGETEIVRQMLAVNPDAAVAIDSERGWPPIFYASYSRWHQIDPGRAPGLAGVVRVLLDAGASPDTNDGGRPRFRSALRGSVEVNNPDVTAVLLDAGAYPNLGQPIGDAANSRAHRCLELLLAHGARVAGTWALDGAVSADDPIATSLVLDALEAGGGSAEGATEALPEAAANASLPVVVALLAAGADPQATDSDGVPALRLAVRAGKDDIAARLRDVGATDDGTDVDRFIGSCLNGDRRAAEELLTRHPDLRDGLTEKDRAAIVDAAGSRPGETIALMLDLGFPPHARNDLGEQPLHTAAYYGNAAVVRLLINAGADLEARDDRFDGTPLAYATVGSREQAGKHGDWIQTVRTLIEAGASREGVWMLGKPPSDDVVELLQTYGVRPNEPEEQQPDEAIDVPGSIGTGVMADIARHVEAAYRDLDLDLLGSLLHPQVRWTDVCRNSAQVLDWYRALLDGGTRPRVESVEVDRDAVVVGLNLTRQAEGARPASPDRLYQVLTIEDAQVVDIRGYPDRRSALTRTPSED